MKRCSMNADSAHDQPTPDLLWSIPTYIPQEYIFLRPVARLRPSPWPDCLVYILLLSPQPLAERFIINNFLDDLDIIQN